MGSNVYTTSACTFFAPFCWGIFLRKTITWGVRDRIGYRVNVESTGCYWWVYCCILYLIALVHVRERSQVSTGIDALLFVHLYTGEHVNDRQQQMRLFATA